MSTTAIHVVDPAGFLKEAAPHLEEAEAENNLALGIAADLTAHPEVPGSAPFLAWIEEDGGFAGAAVMTPPRPLVITRTGACGIAELVDFLSAAGTRLTGVNGHAGTARMFAGLWASRAALKAVPELETRTYECRSVIPPAPAPGRFRRAEAADEALILRWRAEFHVDAKLPPERPEASREAVARLIKEGRQFLWEDGVPRAMAIWCRPTAHGACISGVYTPPEFRRRGWATAITAALTETLLGSGRRFVCLFTDVANPTSNDIYRRIGYRPVADCAGFAFVT